MTRKALWEDREVVRDTPSTVRKGVVQLLLEFSAFPLLLSLGLHPAVQCQPCLARVLPPQLHRSRNSLIDMPRTVSPG